MGLVKRITVLLSVGVMLFAGCSQKPVPRIDSYLGTTSEGDRVAVSDRVTNAPGPFDAGLVLINDTSAPGSAPALSDRAKSFLTDQIRQRIQAATPIRILKLVTVPESAQLQDESLLARLGREQGVSRLLLVVFSSEESEVPAYLPMTGDPEQGGQRPRVLGYEAVNYALAELALIDSTDGRVLLRSDGRAWTRLNRLNVPLKSNAYPVIHRSLRVAPIYPPEDQAKDILRSIAGDEALEQAVYKLEQAWPKS